MHDQIPPLCWYAIHVKPRQESLVQILLGQKGHEVFLPLRENPRASSRRHGEAKIPAFEGYIFCRLRLTERRTLIVTTPGVIGFVGIRQTPYPIAEQEIEALRRVEASGFKTKDHDWQSRGQRVRITAGALSGIEGCIQRTAHGARLVLSVTLLQRAVAVEIDECCLEPVAEPRPARSRMPVRPALSTSPAAHCRAASAGR